MGSTVVIIRAFANIAEPHMGTDMPVSAYATQDISERTGSERNRLRLNWIQSRSCAPHVLRER